MEISSSNRPELNPKRYVLLTSVKMDATTLNTLTVDKIWNFGHEVSINPLLSIYWQNIELRKHNVICQC